MPLASVAVDRPERPACAALERGLDLEVVARATFAAAPSFDALPYDRERVECWVARVRGTTGKKEPARDLPRAPPGR